MNRNRSIASLTATLFFAVASSLPAADKPSAEKSKPKPPVKVEVRSWEGVEKLIAGHKGRVVVVDIWTTTCGTCIEEFPKFVALGKEFPAGKVSLVSLNCDYDGIEGKPPEFYRPDVLKFLKKHQATFDNVMLDISFLDFLNKIDLSSTPAVLVYGADGKLVKRFDNDKAEKVEDEFTIEHVKKQVERILAVEAD